MYLLAKLKEMTVDTSDWRRPRSALNALYPMDKQRSPGLVRSQTCGSVVPRGAASSHLCSHRGPQIFSGELRRSGKSFSRFGQTEHGEGRTVCYYIYIYRPSRYV
jgi:hypothetical protein